MLNHTAEYALRVVLYIAGENSPDLARVDTIAASLDVPRNYLSKVMHALARAGVLISTRGPRGGFALAHPPEQITLAQVIEPFDPIEDRCLLMRRACSDIEPCVAHHHWREVALQFRSFFRSTTVADIVHGSGETA